jgi:DNA polymerase I
MEANSATHPHLQVVREGLPLDTAQAHLIESVDDAAEFMRWLSTKKKVAFDTESTGLDHDTDHARLVQYGDGRDGWAIPFERWAGVVDDAVKRYEGEYIMHNAPFDWIMMKNGGVNIPRHKCHDTRLKAHVLSSTGPLGLKPLAERYVDPRASAAQQTLNDGIGKHGGWTWANVPVTYEPYWVYGALDPVLTYLLDEKLDPLVQAEAPLSYQLELASQWVCEDMARRGVSVDREYTSDLYDKMTDYIDVVTKWCVDYYGVKPGSNDAVAQKLIDEGVRLVKRTDAGRFSVDKSVLSSIAHPLAQGVLGRRQAVKISSTYLRHYLDLSTRDGRIHPSINTVGGTAKNPFEQGGARGVRTGRMSMDSPNLQNVPIRTKEGKRIRNCFDARCSARCGCDASHTWIKCDFDQIEMRLFTHIADDPEMRKLFGGTVDPFLQATRDVFGDVTILKTDDRRQHMKNAFYAKLYGAGVEKFALTAGIRNEFGDLDLPVAQAFLTRLDQLYPGIRTLQRSIETEANTRRQREGEAYTRSPLTNRKFTADEGREYALMNYAVQGTAGEILKMKMVEVDQAGISQYLVLPVHDEFDFDAPHYEVNDVLATLHDIMNDDTLLSVPITATASVGERWGSVEDV